jgi:predicted ATPase/DNA-binding winged helix-turn-helix (wHTH) protein
MVADLSIAALHFGSFALDRVSGQLLRDGVPVALRARPRALLEVFLRHPGQLLTKDELLTAAWPGLVVEENNLQVQVSVLRKLLGAAAIATEPGRGYRFAWPVGRSTAPVQVPPGVGEPSPPGALLGRATELALLQAQLATARLVTVCGAGGVGKTRLAQAAVGSAAPCRVCWVDLAGLSDPSLLAAWVLDRLADAHDRPSPAGSTLEALDRVLAAEPTLLVLDNAEHLLEAIAQVVDTLLAKVPGLRVLVTSQAPLRLPAEHVLRLAPLGLPPVDAALETALSSGAVALFVQRARAADARFRLDAAALPAVIEICRRLDGLPLALELAAARVPAFGLRNIAALLDERFRLLSAGPRQAPARQQTLLALYDWTYGLLDEPEQRLFRRLGVLSAPLELAGVVSLTRLPLEDDLGDDWRRHDLLATLVERSLLQMDDTDPPRFHLLESARAYAMGKLLETGEHAVLGHASGWYEQAGDCAAQAASATQALVHFGTALELLRLRPADASRDERELQLGLKLGPAIQATLGPAHARCEAVYRRSVELARAAPPGPAAFQALWGYWQFLTLAGRDREAAPFAREIVDMAPALDDDGLQLEALHAEMTTADLLGDAPAVVAHAERIASMYDRCRHHRLSFAFGGHDPGVCALGQGSLNHWLCGRPERAAAMARQALDLAASLDHGYSRATGAFYAAITFAALGDAAALARTAESLVKLSDEYGMAMLLTEGRFFQGRARFEHGETDTGLAQMAEALQAIEASRDLGFVFVYMALLGDALLRAGQAAAVIALVERALGYAALGQGLFLPELLRLRALARQRQGDASWQDDAREAQRMAQAQGATALEERAANCLGGEGPS